MRPFLLRIMCRPRMHRRSKNMNKEAKQSRLVPERVREGIDAQTANHETNT